MVGLNRLKTLLPQRSVAYGLLAGVSVLGLTIGLPPLSLAQQQDLSLEEIFGVPADGKAAAPKEKDKKKTPDSAEAITPIAPADPLAAPAPAAEPIIAAPAPIPEQAADLIKPLSPADAAMPDLSALLPGAEKAANEDVAAKAPPPPPPAPSPSAKSEADAVLDSLFAQPAVLPPAEKAAAMPREKPAPALAAPKEDAANSAAMSADLKKLLDDESKAALSPVEIKKAPVPEPKIVAVPQAPAAPKAPEPLPAPMMPPVSAPAIAEVVPPQPEPELPKPAPVVHAAAPKELQLLEQQAQPPASPPSLMWDQPGAVAPAPAPVDLTQFQTPEHTGATVAALPALPPIVLRLEFLPNTTALAPSTLVAVRQLAATLQQDMSISVDLQGFADLARKGSLEASKRLATRRAENIAIALSEAGVDPSRISVTGVGLDFMPGAARDRVDVVTGR